MKVKAIKVFFDNNGLHKVGDIVEVESLDENLMKPIKESEKKAEKVYENEPEKVVKKPTKAKE